MIDVRNLVTVAEITTSIRDLAAEVDFDQAAAPLDQPSSAGQIEGLQAVSRAS